MQYSHNYRYFLIFTLCSLFTLSLQAAPRTMQIGDRTWKLDYSAEAPHHVLHEYVTGGENVDNWTELLTLEYMPATPITPKEFVERYIEMLKSKVPSTVAVNYKILRADEGAALFEWWIKKPAALAQHEYYKLVKYPKYTRILRYTTKHLATVDKNKVFWIGYIDQKLNPDLPQNATKKLSPPSF